jgi:hypothetical protein
MVRMRRTVYGVLSSALCACAVALLAACGSGTKTVTVANAPTVAQTTTATQPTTTTSATSTPTSSTPTTSSTSTGTATTRSAPEPAFTQSESKVEGLSAATTVVRERGYTPNSTGEYHPEQALRVLLGTRTGTGGQQAFFFVNGRYLGTDSKEPSATLKVISQSDTEVTLGYALYREGAPSGGEAHVTFQLNNGKLTALGKIPSASERN